MCFGAETLATLQLATAAAAAVATYQTQDGMAQAQAKGNEIQTKQLLQEADQTRMDSERQRSQEYQSAATETNRYAAEARANMAAFDALIGEGGTGVSAGRRVAAMGNQNGENLATLSSNASKVQQELGFSERASLNATGQKMASLRPVDAPSAFGTALTIAGAGIKYGKQRDALTNPKSPYRGSID